MLERKGEILKERVTKMSIKEKRQAKKQKRHEKDTGNYDWIDRVEQLDFYYED